ncbi:MAG TPA: DUF4870 domain-containing protein [Propionicimonas sp.]|uniref:DUF4870 domain-containing protein n=1 Tax=Propionicimonas sp. TaxID=1955623 RepID=UPI002F3ECF5C
MEPSEKDTESQVTEPGSQVTEPEPVPDLISRELEQKLTVDDAEPPVPVAPDLDAVEPSGSTSGTATNLDLPSIELPHPAYPEPQQVPPAAAYQTPGQAYGQTTPYAVPEPPPAPAYGQQYSQPGYAPQQGYTPQPGYTPQGGYTPSYSGQQLAYPTGELSASDEATWASAAHWSAILASFVGLGFLGPLIVMLTQGTKSARVRANAVESLNFEITFIIAMVVSLLLMLLIIGFITTPLLGIAWLVLRIIASIQTSNGQDYRYPVNIRLVK